jgi:hypothetical protein
MLAISGPGGRRFKSSLPDQLILCLNLCSHRIPVPSLLVRDVYLCALDTRRGAEVQILSPRPINPYRNLFPQKSPAPSLWFGTFTCARLARRGSEVQILSPRPINPYRNLFSSEIPAPSLWFETFTCARLARRGSEVQILSSRPILLFLSLRSKPLGAARLLRSIMLLKTRCAAWTGRSAYGRRSTTQFENRPLGRPINTFQQSIT